MSITKEWSLYLSYKSDAALSYFGFKDVWILYWPFQIPSSLPYLPVLSPPVNAWLYISSAATSDLMLGYCWPANIKKMYLIFLSFAYSTASFIEKLLLSLNIENVDFVPFLLSLYIFDEK